MKENRGLGKGLKEMGLSELLSSINETHTDIGQLSELRVDSLMPGTYQPRREFEAESLDELAQSIQANGIIQPLIVRPNGMQKYEIIAGERRWRAACIAKLSVVPVVIKDIQDEAAMAMGLIENMQREDLNAIDLAEGVERLVTEFKLSHQNVADVLGKSRSTVTNTLRILQLEDEIKDMLRAHKIEMGHAKSLLAVSPDQRVKVANTVVSRALSVRSTESLVKNLATKQLATTQQAKPELTEQEQEWQNKLTIKYGNYFTFKHGRLTITYKNIDQIRHIIQKLVL